MSKVSFNVSTRYCSFSQSKRSNNKLTLCIQFSKHSGGFAKWRSNLEIICMSLWVLSTCGDNRWFSERCGKKNSRGLSKFSWARCRQVFYFVWFLVHDSRLPTSRKKFAQSHLFACISRLQALFSLSHPHTHTHTQVVLLASRKGSDYNPTHHQGGGTRKIQSQKY